MAFVETASTDAGLVGAFHIQAGELAKLAAEARDNLKFLATLERHFQARRQKLTSASGPGSHLMHKNHRFPTADRGSCPADVFATGRLVRERVLYV